MTDVFETWRPNTFCHITEGDMKVADLFQTAIETDSEDACITALNLLNSVLHAEVIMNKLMRGEYDQEEI